MTWDASDTYQQGLEFFSGVVQAVDAAQWDLSTPCDQWRVRDVVGHVGEASQMGARILRGEDLTFNRHDPPGELVAGEPAAWWADVADDARDAVSGVTDLDREVEGPMGRRTVREGLSFPAVDLFVHAWDIGAATGQQVTLPSEAIEFAQALFTHVPPEASRRPGVFAAAIDEPEGASPTEAFIAFTGRDPRWARTD